MSSYHIQINLIKFYITYSQVGIAIDASVEAVARQRVGEITIRIGTNELILKYF